jgi:hypothetical protein
MLRIGSRVADLRHVKERGSRIQGGILSAISRPSVPHSLTERLHTRAVRGSIEGSTLVQHGRPWSWRRELKEAAHKGPVQYRPTCLRGLPGRSTNLHVSIYRPVEVFLHILLNHIAALVLSSLCWVFLQMLDISVLASTLAGTSTLSMIMLMNLD